jgi:DNA-binding transcriptional LysR family regulator
MQQPGVRALSAFVAVAERRSFAKAAVELGLSRSALSETIRALEARLGVRLLNRTTRSVSLTAAGERLLSHVRPPLAELAAAIESVAAFRDRPAGLLRLTVAPPAARSLLAPLLARFLAQHPEIQIEVSVDAALVDIVAERFDAGIRGGERVARDMIAIRVSDDLRLLVFAAPSYLARRPPPATPYDLEAHDCIRIRIAGGGFLPWTFERKGKRIEVAVEGSIIVNDLDFSLRAAIEGAGLVQLPEDQAAPFVAARRLVPLLADWGSRVVGFHLYHSSRRQVPPPLQALIAFLRANRPRGAGLPATHGRA